MDDQLLTRPTLLNRLKSGSTNADWEDFYRQYSGVILRFCHFRGLDEFSARDVLQETMMLILRKLSGFEYDAERGRFRNWVLALVSGKVSEAIRRAQRSRTASLEESARVRAAAMAAEAPGKNAAEELDATWRRALLEEAMQRVAEDPRTKPETLAVFRAVAIEGQPVADVARAYQLQPNAVYQIKDRMMRRLREEFAALLDLQEHRDV